MNDKKELARVPAPFLLGSMFFSSRHAISMLSLVSIATLLFIDELLLLEVIVIRTGKRGLR